MVLTLIYAIWERRNKWCFQGQRMSHVKVLDWARSLAMADMGGGEDEVGGLLRGGNVVFGHGAAASVARSRWKPPRQGTVKLNVDVALLRGNLMVLAC